MKIKWLGHACFLLTSQEGTRILTDPYHSNAELAYGPVREMADIVLVSHDHFDHNNTDAVSGNPAVVKGIGKQNIRGISIEGFPAWHDTAGGRKRGAMVVFVMEVDGLRLCHLGDLGHDLDPAQAASLGKVDILFAPVGGVYTIDGAGVDRLCRLVNPRIVIPMHYKTPKVAIPVAGVDAFIRGKNNFLMSAVSEIEINPDKLPGATQVIVLNPAN